MVEIQTVRDSLVPSVTGAGPEIATVAEAAEHAINRIVDAMNVRSDGRAIFGGGHATLDAVSAASTIRGDLDLLAAAATDPDALQQSVEAYFAAGGPFETTRTVPLPTEAPSFVTAGAREEWTISVADPSVRTALEGVGYAYALGQTSFDQSLVEAVLVDRLPAAVATSADGAIGLRESIGRFEADMQRAFDDVKRLGFDASRRRNELVGADPYLTATQLEQETTRLETIYTLTARLSRLNLAERLG
ncbi:hypothetical protein [Jannaschia aquimarina]|uniref:hypothetical protein n=1 Tax=Jannaschia aquimarina TaxID=935700 RepID=UPI0011305ED4|nr:hypothetical protein [Jannaschia aquimarina]